MRDELFYGLHRIGGEVSAREWQDFVDSVVAPQSPAGFTVVEATGLWRDETGAVVREPSRVLLIVHPYCREEEHALGAVIAEYRERFHQESVERVTTPARARF